MATAFTLRFYPIENETKVFCNEKLYGGTLFFFSHQHLNDSLQVFLVVLSFYNMLLRYEGWSCSGVVRKRVSQNFQ